MPLGRVVSSHWWFCGAFTMFPLSCVTAGSYFVTARVDGVGASTVVGRAGMTNWKQKMFFSEEKNQKTFTSLGRA
jgi:hypothetical protein